MTKTLIFKRMESLIQKPTFDFLGLVQMCEHGPVSREQFAMQMLLTHKSEFELLINSASTPELLQRPKEITMGEYMFPRNEWHELIEVNRTMQMIYLWVLIVAGRYDLFTECQREDLRLSQNSFVELQEMVRLYLGDDPFEIIEVIQRLKIVMAGMSVHDAGKNRGVISDMIRSIGLSVDDFEDHDSLLKKLLKSAPEQISALFARMSDSEKEILMQFFSVDLILGQVAQGEATGVDIEQSGLRLLTLEQRFMWYMKETLDIAGAAGQSTQNGSAVLNELTWRAVKMSIDQLERFADKGEAGTAVMQSLLFNRVAEYKPLVLHDKRRYVLGRLVAMLRKFTLSEISEIDYIIDVFADKNALEYTYIVDWLTADGTERPAVLTYYSPALFQNSIKHFGYNKGVLITLKILAKTFQTATQLLSQEGNKRVRITFFLGDAANSVFDKTDSWNTSVVLTKTMHGEFNVTLEK